MGTATVACWTSWVMHTLASLLQLEASEHMVVMHGKDIQHPSEMQITARVHGITCHTHRHRPSLQLQSKMPKRCSELPRTTRSLTGSSVTTLDVCQSKKRLAGWQTDLQVWNKLVKKVASIHWLINLSTQSRVR